MSEVAGYYQILSNIGIYLQFTETCQYLKFVQLFLKSDICTGRQVGLYIDSVVVDNSKQRWDT